MIHIFPRFITPQKLIWLMSNFSERHRDPARVSESAGVYHFARDHNAENIKGRFEEHKSSGESREQS